MKQNFSKVLNKIEPILYLPETIFTAFHAAQKSVPISNQQAEKILLFLPLLDFPLLSLHSPFCVLLFYFFQLLLSTQNTRVYFFIEPALLLSFGFFYPDLAPFAFLFLLTGWIFMHMSFAVVYHHPVNRFFWIAVILFFPSSITFLAPLLCSLGLAVAIHKRFFVWGENQSE